MIIFSDILKLTGSKDGPIFRESVGDVARHVRARKKLVAAASLGRRGWDATGTDVAEDIQFTIDVGQDETTA